MICQLDLPSVPALVIHGDPHLKFLRSVRNAIDVNTQKLFATVRKFVITTPNEFLDINTIDLIINGILESSPETFCQDHPQTRIERWADWLDEEIDWGEDYYSIPDTKTETLFRTIRTCLKNHSKLLPQLHRAELNILNYSRP